MKLSDLILRCYAERRGDVWQAFCLDLNLAVQGESFDEVRGKLEEMMSEYLNDALAGEDRAHAVDLLNRKAPLFFWLKYYWMRVQIFVRRTLDGFHGATLVHKRPFTELMPVELQHRKHA